MIEITNLAVAIRDTAALDAEGVVALQMAQDLSHTRQGEMVDVFMLARRRHKFLPRTVELLDLFAEVLKSRADEAERMRNKAMLDQQARIEEDRRLHPENYCSFADIVREAAPMQEHVAKVEGRAAAAKAQQAAHDNAPKIEECPHCGRPIPMRVADLRGLTIAQLEGLIEGKKLYAAQHDANLAAAKGVLLDAIAAAHEQDAEMKRKGEAAKARLAGEPPPALPKKIRLKKGTR